MAEPPSQSKLKIREIVQLEMEIATLIQETKNISESQFELNQVNAEVKRLIQSLRRKLEELKQFGEEQDRESSHAQIKQQVENHYNNLYNMQGRFRKAITKAQISIEKCEKNKLMSRLPQSELRHRQQSKEGLAKNASSITENLMSIAKMMESQVQQSRNNTEVLSVKGDYVGLFEKKPIPSVMLVGPGPGTQYSTNSKKQTKEMDKLHSAINDYQVSPVMSSKGITDANEELKGLSGFIHTSKQLLNKYNRRETTDKLLIFFGLVLFFSTVLYIIKKRIFTW